ncbi:class I adenylate-forming enzyme family protein [Rhodococcus sp. ZPP]|uniref:AMP-binding protein n=1 Tax=Rhodococcus sp. ZPP TaxID=2749906 RepID=UPI001FCBB16B|nr:class I adenylate-forming enzyme family protein [Rhodococcus sp. ZPP]
MSVGPMTYKGDWCEVTPVGDLLLRGAHRHPHQDLIVFPGSRHTYVEVLDRAIWIARGLLALGVRRADHVGLLAPNGIEFVEGFFGAALIGSIVVPLNARHNATELAYIVANADLKVLLTLAGTDEYVDFVDLIHDALRSLAGSTSPSRLALPEAPRPEAARRRAHPG